MSVCKMLLSEKCWYPQRGDPSTAGYDVKCWNDGIVVWSFLWGLYSSSFCSFSHVESILSIFSLATSPTSRQPWRDRCVASSLWRSVICLCLFWRLAFFISGSVRKKPQMQCVNDTKMLIKMLSFHSSRVASITVPLPLKKKKKILWMRE